MDFSVEEWLASQDVDWLTPLRVTWRLSTASAVFLGNAAYISASSLFQIARVPTLAFIRLVLVVLSPVTFLIQYSLVPVYFILSVLVSLEVSMHLLSSPILSLQKTNAKLFRSVKPLYIFVSYFIPDLVKFQRPLTESAQFACAALVGIIAGLVLNYTSIILGSICGLDNSNDQGRTVGQLKLEGRKYGNDEATTNWERLEKTWKDSAVKSKPRKRRTRGLLPQTILEEDDDS